MDSWSVINLGHSPKQPLISLGSELSYGLEPHDTIYSWLLTRALTVVPVTGVEGVPGVCGQWVVGRVLYRVLTQSSAEASFDAYLMNI